MEYQEHLLQIILLKIKKHIICNFYSYTTIRVYDLKM